MSSVYDIPSLGSAPAAAQTDEGSRTARWRHASVAQPGAALEILRSCWGLLLRDAAVLRSAIGEFLIRTLAQPVLFVFVFTFLFPRIGQRVGDGAYGDVLVPGLIAVSTVFCGVSSVSLPLAIEFGATREIEDRVLVPVPLWAVGLEKVAWGAAQSAVAGLLVIPLAVLFGNAPLSLSAAQLPPFLGVLALACWISGALGLVVGTMVPPQRMGLVFSVLVVPLSFLGCAYYPWIALRPVPWLSWAVLANPVTYLSEGLRSSWSPSVPHLDPGITFAAALVFAVALTVAGGWLFARRVTRL